MPGLVCRVRVVFRTLVDELVGQVDGLGAEAQIDDLQCGSIPGR
jgi:hypothetical protein